MAPPSEKELRILLTGGRGFVGAALSTRIALLHAGWCVEAPPATGRQGERLDVTDAEGVAKWIRAYRPDVVVHLAAISAVPEAMKNPRATWDINLMGTLNLVLGLQAHSPSTHLIFVSSAEVYGTSLGGPTPTTEEALLQPANAYAASKAAADLLVRQVASSGLPATIMRPFNHTGPGQREAFVAPSFAGQIARIEAGLQPAVLLVGDLDDERDFLDVQDVAAAYCAVIKQRSKFDRGVVFNVASGFPMRVGDLLEKMLSKAKMSIRVQVDPTRLRQGAKRCIVGDATRLRQATGWRPQIGIDDTLIRLLDAQRHTTRGAGQGDAA